MKVISKAIAKQFGYKTYYTGKPCINGHFSERYVSTGTCIECLNGTRKIPNSAPSYDWETLRQQIVSRYNSSVFNAKNQSLVVIEKLNEKIKKLDEKYQADRLKIDNEILAHRSAIDGALLEYSKLHEASLLELENKRLQAITNAEEIKGFEADKARKLLAAEAKSIYLASIVKHKLILHVNDLKITQETVLALSMARCYSLTLRDIWPDKPPRNGVLYEVKLHPDDIATVDAFCKANYEPYVKVMLTEMKKQVMSKLDELVPPEKAPGFDEADIKSTFK